MKTEESKTEDSKTEVSKSEARSPKHEVCSMKSEARSPKKWSLKLIFSSSEDEDDRQF